MSSTGCAATAITGWSFGLSRLEFLGAAGLTVFLRADVEFRAIGGCITLAQPDALVRRVLAITGLDTQLIIE